MQGDAVAAVGDRNAIGGDAGAVIFIKGGRIGPRHLQHRVLRLAARRGIDFAAEAVERGALRSEEHTSELQSLMRISYAVFCLKKQKNETSPSSLVIHISQHDRVLLTYHIHIDYPALIDLDTRS